MLQQAVFGNSKNVLKRSVFKSQAQNESQFKRFTWLRDSMNVNVPIFYKYNFAFVEKKKCYPARYWSPGSDFISELFRSLMPTFNTVPRRRLHAVVLKRSSFEKNQKKPVKTTGTKEWHENNGLWSYLYKGWQPLCAWLDLRDQDLHVPKFNAVWGGL